MAGCCGGKNAGKPISRKRYYLGLGFFVTYHSVVHASLSMGALVNPRLRPVRAFHSEYFGHLLKEALGQEGISFFGEECEVESMTAGE